MKTLLTAAGVSLCALVCGCQPTLSEEASAGLERCRAWQIYTGYTVRNGFECHHVEAENRWVVSFLQYSNRFELASFEYANP